MKPIISQIGQNPMTSALNQIQLETLRDFYHIFPESQSTLIGAVALGFYLEVSWRKTADIDLVVALDQNEVLTALSQYSDWTRHPRHAYRFQSPQGPFLNIIPAGQEFSEKGMVELENGQTMNFAGIDLALTHSVAHKALNSLEVKVSPPSCIAVLKMESFLIRPYERLRDLQDIAQLLDVYIDDTSNRFWDVGVEHIGNFDLVPAYLLGQDIGKIVTERHVQTLQDFFQTLIDPESVHHAWMERHGPSHWSAEKEPLLERLKVLGKGIEYSLGTNILDGET
ncbi:MULTISPECIES: nucleotidyl transferase AbiEii/AbiGii toxin family protein [Thiorhodovibrio]|uniref:nucleotidyl transferase AbiEii/AbiGii toxin family protein n=1 Tax=Thiorhodovibrio TaxID=61593 RepID=UPI0019115FD9|nr:MULTISPECIES: nucleotidyl transferase AbiEii/AbiGii toxin family protein [Thiorhodovibrio]